MSLKAIVKSVLSGDTLILRGRPGPQGQPPKERVLHIAEIHAPRLGNAQRDDEPFAYESRDFLRTLAVGKEISFISTHSLPTTDSTPRDFGHAQIGDIDLATEMLSAGWAKCKENKREDTEADLARKELEAEARATGKGLWATEEPIRTVYYTMPPDSQNFVNEWKGKNIDALVESVRDGSTLRVRLMLPENVHQIINLSLAGVRSPRASGREGEVAEDWGEEAKFFTESRLLQRPVRVQLLALPTPAAIPFANSASSAPPPPASIIIGSVLHPAGNIAEHLVAAGLARVVDWHAGMLSASGAMERLRAAEKVGKEKKIGVYAHSAAAANGTKSTANGSSPSENGPTQFEAQVVRIWNGDQISVIPKGSTKERRLQLSSLRAPKAEHGAYTADAKEFLRKKLIGKIVRVHIDFVRPAEGDFEERECATIRYGGANSNIAEQLIEKGLATALRHKRDDENRSPDYDKLTAAEQVAVADARGMHSGKVVPLPRIGNASETFAKATQFLNSFKRAGRMQANVLNVTSGSRFKLFVPKENQTLTLVLAGIRAPRPARTAFDKHARPNDRSNNSIIEKAEPYGQESLDFSIRKYMQRDVEVEFDSTDKSGGFIGTMYVNKTDNAAIELAREGLATVHAYSAEGLPWAKQVFDAEAEAKAAHRNIWEDYSEETEAAEAVVEANGGTPLKTEYLDVIISDVRTTPSFGFSVQLLNNDGIAALERLMHEFSLHHRNASSVPGFTPRGGELVSARFSGDGGWYRAKVRRSSPAKKEAELSFIDYGNQETVSFANIRPLDPKFRSLPGQAQEARLSFVKLVAPTSEYHEEAVERFRSLCEGRKLVANVDHREGSLLHLRLIDPSDPASASDPLACINADLVREGYASVDRKECRYSSAYPALLAKFKSAIEGAKRDRLGMYELGDIGDDEE